MIGRLKYPFTSLWRRVGCHLAPAITALILGAFAIMCMDRNLPQEVTWGKVVPPTVVAGQPVKFHFGLKKYTDYGGTLKRWITDSHGQIHPLTDSPTVNDQVKGYGVETEITKDFTVPCGIAVGSANYHSTAYVYAWWNLVQRVYPVSHDIAYEFNVQPGQWKNACGLTGGAGQGIQGIQGIPGPQGDAAPVVLRPRIIHKVWIEPTAMSPGGKFVVHIDATMNQLCPGETHWSIVRASDGVEVVNVTQPTVPTKLGENRLTNERTLPLTVLPGEYYYVASVHEFCGPDRTTYIVTTEHIPLTVVTK